MHRVPFFLASLGFALHAPSHLFSPPRPYATPSAPSTATLIIDDTFLIVFTASLHREQRARQFPSDSLRPKGAGQSVYEHTHTSTHITAFSGSYLSFPSKV